MRRFAVLAVSLLFAVAALAQNGTVRRTAPILGKSGEAIGEVTVVGTANATVIRIAIGPGGLTPGWHGMHFHAVGDCSDPERFAHAKGIVDNIGRGHGLLNPDGPKEGDLPNVFAAPDGSLTAEVLSHAARMLGPTGLVEGDGAALIIHAAEDDQLSQPVGNSGQRMACAVLK